MNKAEAIEALQAGEKLTHNWFSPDEWVTESFGMYQFEDDCICDPREFWQGRDDESWENGWEIFSKNDINAEQADVSYVVKNNRFVDSRPHKAEDYQRMHTTIVRDSRKIGRNEPCPCGSGRKYKKCHLIGVIAHA